MVSDSLPAEKSNRMQAEMKSRKPDLKGKVKPLKRNDLLPEMSEKEAGNFLEIHFSEMKTAVSFLSRTVVNYCILCFSREDFEGGNRK